MSKIAFASMSLIAAIPAGYLTVSLVLVFLNYADETTGMMLALAGVTLVSSFAVALIPVGILVFAPKDDKPQAAEPEADDDVDEDQEDIGFGDSIPEEFDADESMRSLDEDGADEDFDYDDADGGAESEDLHDTFVAEGGESGTNEDFGEMVSEEDALDVDDSQGEDIFEEEIDDDFDLELEDDDSTA